MRTRRLFKIIKVLISVWYFQVTSNARRMSETIYDGFNDLGGIYVKFLQLMMVRSDIFERWETIDHLRVYEDVATEPLDIEALLADELGNKRGQLNLEATEPFTAGSFGQVYKATLADGRKVIIKALRPSLTKHLKFDLRLINVAVRFINWVKPGAMIDMKMLFIDFKSTTLGETNYHREAAFGNSLRERYHDHPSLVIPYTYPELSTRHVLVQDYVGGVSASQLLELRRKGEDVVTFVKEKLGSDLNSQMKMLGFELIYGVFKYDSTQGDPHPGNVKLLQGNKVGLIDFGIVADSPKDLSVVLDLMKEYRKFYWGEFDVQSFSVTALRFYAADLVAAIRGLDSLPGQRNRADSILQELGDTAESTFMSSENRLTHERLLARGRLMTTFATVVNEGNRFGLRLHHDAPNFIRAAQMFVVLADSLGCKREVLPTVFDTIVKRVEGDEEVLEGNHRISDINRSLEIVSAWLDRVSAKDPMLFRRLHDHVKSPANV